MRYTYAREAFIIVHVLCVEYGIRDTKKNHLMLCLCRLWPLLVGWYSPAPPLLRGAQRPGDVVIVQSGGGLGRGSVKRFISRPVIRRNPPLTACVSARLKPVLSFFVCLRFKLCLPSAQTIFGRVHRYHFVRQSTLSYESIFSRPPTIGSRYPPCCWVRHRITSRFSPSTSPTRTPRRAREDRRSLTSEKFRGERVVGVHRMGLRPVAATFYA